MNLKSISLLLLVLNSLSVLIAQECKLVFSGFVEDFHDKSSIVGATIFVKNLNKYTTTDTEGKFTLKNICPGTITVHVSHVACDPQEFHFEVSSDILC